MLVYLDTSALIRLAIDDGAEGLIRYLGTDPSLITCRIAEAEPEAQAVLDAVAIREVDSTLLRKAAQVTSAEVDLASALHLAAALELKSELEAFVTYDDRVAAAARSLRLPAVTPA